jgi:hypothetical protein
MLVLLIGATVTIFASCGGKDAIAPADVQAQAFEDLRTEGRAAIDDPEREEKAIRLVDELATDFAALRESISERNQQARQLHSSYDTMRAEFDKFLAQMYGEIQASQQLVTKRQHALIAITTADEWTQISDARTEAMSAAIAYIQAN